MSLEIKQYPSPEGLANALFGYMNKYIRDPKWVKDHLYEKKQIVNFSKDFFQLLSLNAKFASTRFLWDGRNITLQSFVLAFHAIMQAEQIHFTRSFKQLVIEKFDSLEKLEHRR
jgi:hypothetical protein